MRISLIAVFLTLSCSAAVADPCGGKLPKAGTNFQGQVRYVGDGDSLCVGNTANSNEWIEVRIADFYAPELNAAGGRDAKAALERIAMGKLAMCTAGKRSYDRVVATCSINGRSVADWMKAADVPEGGRGRL
ncbi:nuclease [Rhizomicrobium sp. SCGC AG-212-E05]|nr:nuclease [Rhizomicrobium sp. SCGC AG-212-E05]